MPGNGRPSSRTTGSGCRLGSSCSSPRELLTAVRRGRKQGLCIVEGGWASEELQAQPSTEETSAKDSTRTELTGNEGVSRNAPEMHHGCSSDDASLSPSNRQKRNFSKTDRAACTLLALNQSNGTANSRDTNWHQSAARQVVAIGVDG